MPALVPWCPSRPQFCAASCFLVLLAGAALPAVAGPLTFEERVEAQRAIEEVYWRHRIWPAQNPGPKPPLSAVMPDEEIRAKVEDYLKKSNALEKFWHRPVTGEQLQAEMDRMARSTRDPKVLRKLYETLGNDARLIAEALARPALVERLIRNWYAYDDRLHGEVERRARETLAGIRSVAEMRTLGGEYAERTFRRSDGDEAGHDLASSQVSLGADEWGGWTSRLARWLGATAPEQMAIGRRSALQEEPDRFLAVAVLSLSEDEVTVATVSWPKRSFDAWWAEVAASLGLEVPSCGLSIVLHSPTGGGCANDTWRLRSGAPTRWGHTAVWTGSEMIIWGGEDETFLYAKTGGRYDAATDTWTLTASAPNGALGHSAVWTGTEMIVWGGYNSGDLNSGSRYNPASDTWMPTSVSVEVPAGRVGHTAVWTGTEMIVWGGVGNDAELNTGGRYNPETDSWIPTSTSFGAPFPRSMHTAVWTGSEMIVWGGAGPDPFDATSSGGRYVPETDSWVVTPFGPSARICHTAVWTGTEMIVWGGGRLQDDDQQNTGGRYNPSTNSWVPTSTGAAVPAGRWRHTAVWTGTEMIVWGGEGNDAEPSTGGRYDPAADSWTSTPTLGAPPSSGATTVWTDAEMIAWGGDSGNTGGRYDPATDTWVPTTGGDAPLARSGHVAVWTGSEMIIWGGTHAGFFIYEDLGSGGRYDPATDVWSPTSNPESYDIYGRKSPEAVWTGTEMIVWGGDRQGHVLNSGGRYFPGTDTWSPTSNGPGVPSGRFGHTAVWTGNDMIVWGGRGWGTGPVNSGARYLVPVE